MSADDDARRQDEELDSLKAIYDADFAEKPQKAWKVGRESGTIPPCRVLTANQGATPFREFSIQVRHSAPHLRDVFKLQLNFRCVHVC